MIEMNNKVAVITGGSRGIGAACGILFARAGSDVVFSYRKNETAAHRVVDAIEREGRKGIPVCGNMGKMNAARTLIETTIDAFGKIDVLINNVGIWNFLEVGEEEPEVFEKNLSELLDVNLKSYFFTTHLAVPHMKKAGGGRIINISSTAGQRGEAHHAHYAASKGGIISMTKSLAVELAPYGILVNSVAPGWVDNDMNAGVFGQAGFKQQIIDSIPLKKIATNEDIAGAVLFLASTLAGQITGEVINVNGGSVLCG